MQQLPNARKTMSIETMEAFYDLKEKRQLCDATLMLENGHEIPIHTTILSGCSSLFRAFFTDTLQNHKNKKMPIIGVRPEIMNILINYIYLRKMDLNQKNVFDVMIAADYLGIIGAVKMCSQYLQDNLNPQNCIHVLQFAKNYLCADLERTTWKYVMQNFVSITELNEDFFKLPLNEFEAILASDTLNAKSEETVWQAILTWINKDPENRKQHIASLLKCIRLGLLETNYFMENVKDHPYVTSSEGSRPIVIETLKFLYDLESITHKSAEVTTPALARPRLPHEVLFAIGGWSGGSPTNYMETYDTRADRWIRVEEVDPAGPRAYHGTIVVGQKIYVIGGFDGMDYFNSCRCFDPVTKTWKEIAPMHAKRCYVSTASLCDTIYAMGGYDGHHRQNTAERYNYKTNQWTFIASMNMQRSDASATSLNGKIYITGGFNGQECMHSAEVYDPEINQWSLISAMRSRRSGVSCISYHGYVYVIGGFNGISRMCSGEKYNPETNSWSPIPDMYNPRSNFAIEVVDEMIFVIGGFNGVTTIYHVECYDDKTNEWYEATDMNIYRSALSACVVNNLPNVNDYIHKHRERLMEEKRQKLLALENQRHEAQNIPIPPPLNIAAAANLQHLNVIQQLQNNVALQQVQAQLDMEDNEENDNVIN